MHLCELGLRGTLQLQMLDLIDWFITFAEAGYVLVESVCLYTLLRSQFSLDFDETLHRSLEPKVVGSQNPTTPSPIFPQPKFFTLLQPTVTEKVWTDFDEISWMGIGHGPGTKWLNFGDDPDYPPDPGVRSPKSGFTGLSKKLPTDFDEILWGAGVWPRD